MMRGERGEEENCEGGAVLNLDRRELASIDGAALKPQLPLPVFLSPPPIVPRHRSPHSRQAFIFAMSLFIYIGHETSFINSLRKQTPSGI